VGKEGRRKGEKNRQQTRRKENTAFLSSFRETTAMEKNSSLDVLNPATSPHVPPLTLLIPIRFSYRPLRKPPFTLRHTQGERGRYRHETETVRAELVEAGPGRSVMDKDHVESV
jgi:hypothetical protein